MKRDTVGKISSELLKKDDPNHSYHEQMKEQLSEWDDNIFQAYLEGKSKYQSDFFIVVLTKKERLMENVIRNYFITRKTCPTPDYDQTVYRFNMVTGDIDFLWVIPNKNTCLWMLDNSLRLMPDEKPLLNMVIDFKNGHLYQKAKALNGEAVDSNLIEH